LASWRELSRSLADRIAEGGLILESKRITTKWAKLRGNRGDPENPNDFEQEKAEKAEIAEIEAIESRIGADLRSSDEGAAVFI
jgi:hypothetical protein